MRIKRFTNWSKKILYDFYLEKIDNYQDNALVQNQLSLQTKEEIAKELSIIWFSIFLKMIIDDFEKEIMIIRHKPGAFAPEILDLYLKRNSGADREKAYKEILLVEYKKYVNEDSYSYKFLDLFLLDDVLTGNSFLAYLREAILPYSLHNDLYEETLSYFLEDKNLLAEIRDLKKHLRSFDKKEINRTKNSKTVKLIKEILNLNISEIEKLKIKKLLKAVIIERFFEKEMIEQQISIVDELNIYNMNVPKEILKIVLDKLNNPDDLVRNRLMLISVRLKIKEK
jgi:hypothetical protein